jgi:hypothetical protein
LPPRKRRTRATSASSGVAGFYSFRDRGQTLVRTTYIIAGMHLVPATCRALWDKVEGRPVPRVGSDADVIDTNLASFGSQTRPGVGSWRFDVEEGEVEEREDGEVEEDARFTHGDIHFDETHHAGSENEDSEDETHHAGSENKEDSENPELEILRGEDQDDDDSDVEDMVKDSHRALDSPVSDAESEVDLEDLTNANRNQTPPPHASAVDHSPHTGYVNRSAHGTFYR